MTFRYELRRVALAAMLSVGCSRTGDDHVLTRAETETVLQVHGLRCSCGDLIREALDTVDGVIRVDGDFVEGRVVVRHDRRGPRWTRLRPRSTPPDSLASCTRSDAMVHPIAFHLVVVLLAASALAFPSAATAQPDEAAFVTATGEDMGSHGRADVIGKRDGVSKVIANHGEPAVV